VVSRGGRRDYDGSGDRNGGPVSYDDVMSQSGGRNGGQVSYDDVMSHSGGRNGGQVSYDDVMSQSPSDSNERLVEVRNYFTFSIQLLFSVSFNLRSQSTRLC